MNVEELQELELELHRWYYTYKLSIRIRYVAKLHDEYAKGFFSLSVPQSGYQKGRKNLTFLPA